MVDQHYPEAWQKKLAPYVDVKSALADKQDELEEMRAASGNKTGRLPTLTTVGGLTGQGDGSDIDWSKGRPCIGCGKTSCHFGAANCAAPTGYVLPGAPPEIVAKAKAAEGR